MTNFEERRSSILGVFQKAKEDLEALNKDINDQINENTQAINSLNKENTRLKNLITQNEKSANVFKSIFKV